MKNNQEKLTDAFGMLREDTLDACVTDKAAPRSVRSRTARRVAVLLAACLTFAMMASLMLILPALRADGDGPIFGVDAPSQDPTETPDEPLPELIYYNAPLVNVQILSLSEDEVKNPDTLPDAPIEQDIATTYGGGLYGSDAYILFTLEEGETVTARAQNSKLCAATLWNYDFSFAYDSWYAKFLQETADGHVKNFASDYEITLNSAEDFLHWGGYSRYWGSEETKIGTPDEDLVDFIYRNAEGHITGAGSIYMVNRKLVDNPDSRYYDEISISRAKVLGSVRFESPADVTEEQVDAYLTTLHESVEEIRGTMFHNLNTFEQFKTALGDLINTRYPDCDNFGSSLGYSSKDRYVPISIFNDKDPDFKEGSFLLMDDGTWGEILYSDNFCEYCALFNSDKTSLSTPPCDHWSFTHERFIMTDGSIWDEHREYVPVGEFKVSSSYLVPVGEDTYTSTAPDPALVIRDLLFSTDAMEEAVIKAYGNVEQELDGHAQILAADQPFRWGDNNQTTWARFATLTVRDASGNTRNYLVLEDGSHFEYSEARYVCSVCAYYSPDRDWTNDLHSHERTAVFYLTAGGTYSARINWAAYECDEPVYNP